MQLTAANNRTISRSRSRLSGTSIGTKSKTNRLGLLPALATLPPFTSLLAPEPALTVSEAVPSNVNCIAQLRVAPTATVALASHDRTLILTKADVSTKRHVMS